MEGVLEFLRLYARSENLPFDADGWALVDSPASLPRQEDAESCGVFVCVYADRLARNAPITEPIDANAARLAIAEVLKRGKFDREDFQNRRNVNPVPPQSSAVTIDLTLPVDEPPSEVFEVVEEVTGEVEQHADRRAAEEARLLGDETSAMLLDDVAEDEAAGREPVESQEACLDLEDGELVVELDAEPAARPAVQSRLGDCQRGEDRRQHRHPGSRREHKRRHERHRDETRRYQGSQQRQMVERSRGLGGHRVRRPDHGVEPNRRNPEGVSTRRRREGGPQQQGPCQRRNEETRRRAHVDLRYKLLARRCERLHSPQRSGRSGDMAHRQERRFAERAERRPPACSQSNVRVDTEASGQQGFQVPQHLRDRLAELETQGWSKTDLRNKRWVVTRADGSKFKIRAAKLRTLETLH